MKIRVNNIKAPLTADLNELKKLAAKKIGLPASCLRSFTQVKKSVDARNKKQICLVCAVECEISDDCLISGSSDIEEKTPEDEFCVPHGTSKIRPLIVGSGPAGMMAALAMAEAGLRPVVLERGRDVDRRKHDVDIFWKTGNLNLTSNVQFGEGGAGTFSDGKLMTGIKKDKYVRKVLHEFTQAGAPEEILYLAKPHIGTDKLVTMVKNIRRKIESHGGEYRFEQQLTGLVIKDGKICGAEVKIASGETECIPCEDIILAIGHSARDTFEMLYQSQVEMQQKPFFGGSPN